MYSLGSVIYIIRVSSGLPTTYFAIASMLWSTFIRTTKLSLTDIQPSFPRSLFRAWMLIECLFYAYYYFFHLPACKMVPTAIAPTHSTEEERAHAFTEVFDKIRDAKLMTQRQFLSKWFFDVPVEQMRRQNVFVWTAAHTFTCTADQLTPEQVEEINRRVDWLEERLEISFPSGLDPNIASIKHTIDPLTSSYRPFLFYFLVRSATLVGEEKLKRQGFEWYKGTLFSGKAFNYWYLKGRKPAIHNTTTYFPIDSPPPSQYFGGKHAPAHAHSAQTTKGLGGHQPAASPSTSISSSSSSSSSSSHCFPSHFSSPSSSSSDESLPIVFIHGIGLGPWMYMTLIGEIVKVVEYVYNKQTQRHSNIIYSIVSAFMHI
jgi:hypothetical protein